jgi:hypothetical protein
MTLDITAMAGSGISFSTPKPADYTPADDLGPPFEDEAKVSSKS